MANVTIRKNATKKISALLESAELITCYKDDGFSAEMNRVVTAADVMEAGARFEFDRVYTDGETVSCGIHSNWFYTAYLTKDAARNRMTDRAFARHFPNG